MALLESETAARHTDCFLKAECDFSGVLWLATANRLSTMSAPLLSRLRVLLVPQTERHHLPCIADQFLADVARSWGVDRPVLPEVAELYLPWDRLASVRQVREAVDHAVTQWARAAARH